VNANDVALVERSIERRVEPGAEADTSIVGRVFLILAAFRREPVLGVSELARRTGIPRTSVHRLANQLLDEGALTRVGTKFRIGATLFELGQLHFPQKLREVLQPLLDDLQRMTGHDVALVELVNADVIVIAIARSRRSRAELGHLGQRLPAHATAAGQVLLADSDAFPSGPLAALTSLTLVDRRRLRQRIAAVKLSGVSVEHGESEDGRSSVAMPVLNRHRRVLGAISVTGPTATFDVDAMLSTLGNFSSTLTAAGRQASVGFFASARPRSNE
jgi:IclR family transcriptional regulator, acetate operon repressor